MSSAAVNVGESSSSCVLQVDEESAKLLRDYSSSADFASSAPAPADCDGLDLLVVLCPPDGGSWSVFTCLLSFAASCVCDGVCMSLFLFDGRYGMAEHVPSQTRTLEHIATVLLFRHLIVPISCAYINRYGFRCCLFVGSLLCISWLILLLYSIGNEFLFKYCLISAVVGGIGIGIIKTSFVILLSTLFLWNRQKAHLSRHLGSFAGIMIIPPITEYMLLFSRDWRSALYLHLFMMCSFLVLWFFVATPVPLKIEVVEEKRSLTDKPSSQTQTIMSPAVALDATHAYRNTGSTTIRNAVGGKKLKMVPFTDTKLVSNCNDQIRSPRTPVQGLENMNTLYEKNKKRCIRNFMNMFGTTRIIGSRPMYRDDIHFSGNVASLLALGLKFNEYSEDFEYLMATTRVFAAADLNEEKRGRVGVTAPSSLCPMAARRVLKSMYDASIWRNGHFVLTVASEALVHAARFLPFFFIKGPSGQKSSAEAIITLIAGCLGLFVGRGVGYLLHETQTVPNQIVPLYHVGLVLIANGLSMFLCSAGDFVTMLPYFGLFGFLFGYYTSVKNTVLYSMFPLHKLNNVRGQLSVVRALSSVFGIMMAIEIMQGDEQATANNGSVYNFAGILMTAGGVCVGLLRPDVVASAVAARLGRLSDRGSVRSRHY